MIMSMQLSVAYSVRIEQWIRAKYERKEFIPEEEEAADAQKDVVTSNAAYVTGV